MNTSTPSRDAPRSANDPPSESSKARRNARRAAAKTQHKYAADLFAAIRDGNAADVIRLAPLVDDLDSHLDKTHNERPLMLAARYDMPVAGFQALLARSNPRLTNADGVTALMLAAWGTRPHSVDLTRLLLPRSDPLALTDPLPLSDPLAIFGANSALCYAIRAYCNDQHSTDAISLLLPVSNLAQRDMEGHDSLDQARLANSDVVVELILGEMARREALALAAEISTAPGLSEARNASPRL